jgi:prepilin-type N-terminal cleavage/methylation domain-containing protein
MIKGFKKAFSLIEISVVIIIIGILILGISNGVDLYSDFRIASARSLTLNSRVGRISGLVAWWETSLENSFNKNESVDGAKITNWFDSNPANIDKTTLTQNNNSNKPIYKKNIINSLPAILFEGDDKFITKNIFGENYSIFVIMLSNSLGYGLSNAAAYLNTVIIGADTPGVSNDIIPLALGEDSIKMYTGNGGGSGNTLISNFKIKTKAPYIIFSSRNFENGERKISINNSNQISDSLGGVKVFLNSNSYVGIGADSNIENTQLYNGHLAEIIVYNKILDNLEIESIQKYLSKKYSIKN